MNLQTAECIDKQPGLSPLNDSQTKVQTLTTNFMGLEKGDVKIRTIIVARQWHNSATAFGMNLLNILDRLIRSQVYELSTYAGWSSPIATEEKRGK